MSLSSKIDQRDSGVVIKEWTQPCPFSKDRGRFGAAGARLIPTPCDSPGVYCSNAERYFSSGPESRGYEWAPWTIRYRNTLRSYNSRGIWESGVLWPLG